MKSLFGVDLCLTCLSLMLVGCGGGGASGGPKRHPVSGSVTYSGKPVVSGTITFGPTDAAKGTPDTATIGKDGSFQLERGLAAGDYTVLITSYKRPIADIPPPEMAKLGDSNWAIPKKYTDVKTSDLKFTVKAQSNTAKFELKD